MLGARLPGSLKRSPHADFAVPRVLIGNSTTPHVVSRDSGWDGWVSMTSRRMITCRTGRPSDVRLRRTAGSAYGSDAKRHGSRLGAHALFVARLMEMGRRHAIVREFAREFRAA